jgi:hypothetical protein
MSSKKPWLSYKALIILQIWLYVEGYLTIKTFLILSFPLASIRRI